MRAFCMHLGCFVNDWFGPSQEIMMVFVKRRRVRAKLTPAIIAEIRRRLLLGDFQHDIAADLGLNQGRISEVNTGKR